MLHAEQPGNAWKGRGHPSPDVVIRALDSLFEFEGCEELQRRVWGYADIDVIPTNELINIQKNGGLVLGAFERGGGLVGFVFGFTGYREGKIFHCSRMSIPVFCRELKMKSKGNVLWNTISSKPKLP